MFDQWKGVSKFVADFIGKDPRSFFPGIENEQILKVVKDFMDRVGQIFSSSLGGVLTFAISKIPDMITATLLLVISSTYIVIVLPKLKGMVPYMFPKSTVSDTEKFLRNVYSDMRKFVGGQMFNAIVVGTVVWIGMSIFGIKYAGFLGILSGVTDFIPFLGVIITGVPAILIGISHQGLLGLIKVLIVLTIANQLESWVLAPKVLGSRVRLNWFVVLVTMLALSEIYGAIGILISIPFLVTLRDVWREYMVDYLQKT
jgi:predicted PurR-regulated permease PerM